MELSEKLNGKLRIKSIELFLLYLYDVRIEINCNHCEDVLKIHRSETHGLVRTNIIDQR